MPCNYAKGRFLEKRWKSDKVRKAVKETIEAVDTTLAAVADSTVAANNQVTVE
jgi:hypothetical protein